MKHLPRIVRIHDVKPFLLITTWNNGDERIIDFKPLFKTWDENGEQQFAPLQDFETFKNVKVSEEHTLYWPDVQLTIKLKNREVQVPLDLDPDVLFEHSTLLHTFILPSIGAMLRKARTEAGLSQTAVAINSGTTRNYISRIENDRSDIQIDTLYKIVTLGMGKELKLAIS